MKHNYLAQLKSGILDQNPTLVQLLGMCPTLATTTSLSNAFGMGMAATAVLICSNVFISLLRKFIPKQVRIAAYIVIVSGFVTAVELLMRTYLVSLYRSLGLFIPLIVVNCIILARAEAFASKTPPLPSAMDGLSMGLGFTFALCILGTVRELLGSGTFGAGVFEIVDGSFHAVLDGSAAGIRIFPEEFGATIMIMPFGGFLTLACLLAAMQYALRKSAQKKEAAARAAKVEVVKEAAE